MSSRSDSPIFITGHHRSGKTLVRWLLDSHPEIAVSQRTQLWPKFYRSFGPLTVSENLESCLQALRQRKQVARLNLDWEQVKRDFASGPPTYGRLFQVLHEQFARLKGANRWGDQSMDLDRYADRILETYPNARIIHMLRDPRDAYAGFLEKDARRMDGPGTFSAGWSESARLARENSHAHPESYLVVKYEDLVADPETTAVAIFDFVGESYEPTLLTLENADRYEAARSQSERGWAITPEHIGAGNSLQSCQSAVITSATTSERVEWQYPEEGERKPLEHFLCIPISISNRLLGLLEKWRLCVKRDPSAEGASYSIPMRTWHKLTDSDAFRQTVKRGWASPIFKSRWYRSADIARRRALVRISSGPNFDEVRSFALFIGHNKSGTSLLGALLDANRRMIVSDEANALKYIEAGVPREELFGILLRASASEARKGRVTARRLGAYSYRVPGQWQGRAESPLVVGDSMSGTTTRLLARSPDLIERIELAIGETDLKLLHVVRNPFDPISLMAIRGRRTIENSVDHYFAACSKLVDIHERVGSERILQVHYEDFVTSPVSELERVCRYLGVDPDPRYLEECANIVDNDFEDSRNRISWSSGWIEEVERRMLDFPFLEGYSFDSRSRESLSG